MRFYDTCSLLKKVDSLFDEENFVISSVTLKELESINNISELKTCRLLNYFPLCY